MSAFNIEKELAKVRAENAEYSRNSNYLSTLHDKGELLEKSNDFEGAIAAFEECVSFGEKCPTLHVVNYMRDIDRLVVLYRKQKLYAKEIAVLKIALSYGRKDSYATKQRERLAKAKELLKKQG